MIITSLKQKCRHVENIFVIDCAWYCRNDNVKWQLPVQSNANISSKWRYIGFINKIGTDPARVAYGILTAPVACFTYPKYKQPHGRRIWSYGVCMTPLRFPCRLFMLIMHALISTGVPCAKTNPYGAIWVSSWPYEFCLKRPWNTITGPWAWCDLGINSQIFRMQWAHPMPWFVVRTMQYLGNPFLSSSRVHWPSVPGPLQRIAVTVTANFQMQLWCPVDLPKGTDM